MPWNTLPNLAHEQLVTETHMDQIRENIEWLGALQAAGVAFSTLNAISVARVAVGTYTGNGVDNRWITGVGFTPKFVAVWRSASSYMCFSSSAMPADSTGNVAATGLVADYIQSFNSDGFQVGTNAYVNLNTGTYYWLALG